MKAETNKDVAQTAQTFHHPRYEVIPTGEVYEGLDQVVSFIEESMKTFPDYVFESNTFHHTEEGVIVETSFRGTHLGSWRGLPATRRQVHYRMCNVFVFEQDRLVCERLYFDLLTLLRQLGIARDPTHLAGRISMVLNHPLTFLKAGFQRMFRSRKP